MTRKAKKKALYEVIARGKYKSHYTRGLERLHPKRDGSGAPAGQAGDSGEGARAAYWGKKRRIVQFNSGRIEFSVPYQLGVVVLLAVVVLALVSFRIGQRAGVRQAGGIDIEPAGRSSSAGGVAGEAPQGQGKAAPAVKDTEAAAQPGGRNRIVIQMYQVRAHLEPVKAYFDRMGVQTEILKKDNWYYLVTKNRYENPERKGTDGYGAKEKIIKLGSEYKAPAGYETFAPNFFSDAFGKRFDE